MQQQQHEITNTRNAKATTTTISSLPNAIIQDEDIQQNWPALHEAAATGNESLLTSLLSGGMLRTAKEPKHGNTALHEAAWRGYSRCVKLLCTPPPTSVHQTAVEGGNKKFSCMLRKRKKLTQETQRAAAVHSILLGLQNHAGFTALHLAAQQGHNQSCRELLLAGADADVQNKYGDTALHTACRYGHAGATRILLSASCDANRLNLNGDTPLHISTAMRRRKLTRILLTEGDCNMSLKNAQNETPLDIAIRKSYVEIFDILNNQERLRQQCKQRSKQENKATNNDKKTKTTAAAIAGESSGKTSAAMDAINWSPYGCHYFPDPRAFPAPKLETLPKEPLQQGEQYYCDLNGCIRKGPIGVGSTCYCAPFFRHIEHKLNSNRRSLRKYVHNAKATLGHEVKALAERTNQQIEQLTRDMLCDRVRCESRRRHIDYWLQVAAATQNNSHNDKSSWKNTASKEDELDGDGACGGIRKYSLSRCQSLDALSEHKSSIFMQMSNLRPNNAQSCSLLDDLPASSKEKYVNSTPTDKQSMAGEVSDNNNNDDDDDDDDVNKDDHDNIDNEIMARRSKPEECETKRVQEKLKHVKFNDQTDVDYEENEKEKETQKSVLQLVKEQEKLLGKHLLYKNVSFRLNDQFKQKYEREKEEEEANEHIRNIQKQEQLNFIYGQQKSRPWQTNEGAHKFTIEAEIVQNGNGEYDDDDNVEVTVEPEKREELMVNNGLIGAEFVVTKEKMGTPSYAQLKKTLPAKFRTDMTNVHDPVIELAKTMEGVNLTASPALSGMCAAALEAVSDNNTEEEDDDDDDDDDSEADNVDLHEHEIDYLYELRKSLQTNSKLDITEHVKSFEKPAVVNSMANEQNLTSNYSERVVPKNAYFHPLPNKMQYQNMINNNSNINNNHNNNIINNNNHIPLMLTHKPNRPQNILTLTNGTSNGFLNHSDPRLARRRPFIGHEQDQLNGNSYLSPVNSNSGSSIASSTDYERALRNAAISRQPLHALMKPKVNPQLNFNGIPHHNDHHHHQNNKRNDSGLGHHNYVDPRTFIHNGQNNHAYVLGSLEPASSQLIYSANTVALALSDGQSMEDTAQGTTNGVYPLISSLV